ncbi:hypothetical protein KVT40_003581 [Elsinoe batatas]|uniref:Uncharacterized protein n=1 Tax=Elsinoe batatas TaxID=2601811 RepID=A0A8K0L3V8_9PEZI|nr:hypothetical protein KVT40_003581 [Elsinoe batatas]
MEVMRLWMARVWWTWFWGLRESQRRVLVGEFVKGRGGRSSEVGVGEDLCRFMASVGLDVLMDLTKEKSAARRVEKWNGWFKRAGPKMMSGGRLNAYVDECPTKQVTFRILTTEGMPGEMTAGSKIRGTGQTGKNGCTRRVSASRRESQGGKVQMIPCNTGLPCNVLDRQNWS